MKNGNVLERNTDTTPETRDDTTECNGTEGDTSSGTLEMPSSPKQTAQTVGREKSDSNKYDSSFSTISSEVGSPSLSLNEMKESLSDTYVKLSD